MSPRFKAAGLAGFLIALSGIVLNFIPFGLMLEENLGLDIFFRLRGPRPVPSTVAIVTLDQESAEHLGLPSNPLKWPRNIYTSLVDNLVKKGPSVIVFDVLFSEPTSERDDDLFAKAIRNAGNVVLCEHLRQDLISISKDATSNGPIYVEKSTMPIELFANAASALGPFPLPKVPMRVSQCWIFKTAAGCKPTLPLLAFELFSLPVYKDFFLLLESVSPVDSAILPENAEEIRATGNAGRVAAAIKGIFEDKPRIAEEMLNRLQSRQELRENPGKAGLLERTIKAYTCGDSIFINFYGPPGTITTIPFSRILNPEGEASKLPDLRGKVVFVGLSEFKRADNRDGFHTVYSGSDGTELSGVEIAATAFANLSEDMPVRPASGMVFLSVCFLWGLILGYVCLLLPFALSAGIIAGSVLIYAAVATFIFKNAGIWMPFAVPLVIQTPLAMWSGFLWQHAGAKKERLQIRKAFGFFLPDNIIDQLMSDMKAAKGITHTHQTVFGTVLYSDGAQYTSLAERMSPKELSEFLNRYYEVIFQPVRAHGGIISDIVGDSMLAVWTKTHPDKTLRQNACNAALEIVRTITEFNRESTPYHLHTRIGLHYGQLLLGNIGGANHFEYRPVGDVVNTASRIEGLNKAFGTQVLVSEEAIGGNHGFLTRELGRFMLYGKSNPVTVFELICPIESAQEQQKDKTIIFAKALRAFERQSWDEAEALFLRYLEGNGEDKASRYYISRCDIYRKNPPGEMWNGVVFMDTK